MPLTGVIYEFFYISHYVSLYIVIFVILYILLFDLAPTVFFYKSHHIDVLWFRIIKLFLHHLLLIVVLTNFRSLLRDLFKCPKSFRSLHLSLIILFWTADNWNTHSISSPFGFSHALVRVHTVHKTTLINYWHSKCNSSTKHKPVLDILKLQIKTHIYYNKRILCILYLKRIWIGHFLLFKLNTQFYQLRQTNILK